MKNTTHIELDHRNGVLVGKLRREMETSLNLRFYIRMAINFVNLLL